MGDPADPLPDRYRLQAYRTASQRSVPTVETNGGALLPTHTAAKNSKPTEAGGLDSNNGRGALPSRPSAGLFSLPDTPEHEDGGERKGSQFDGATTAGTIPEESTHHGAEDAISRAAPPAAPPPEFKSSPAGSGNSAIKADEGDDDMCHPKKPSIPKRMKEGSKRFVKHFKNAIFHSWVNVLLVAVPAGIAVKAAGLNASVVFAINAVAIIPLAGLLTHATESVASRLGDTLGALLNVSFGNAVELIIFIIALVKNEIRIVQASLLGSILANLLLILGMAFLFGGLRFREQIYNSTVTQMSACLLSLSVISLLLPTAFHASFNDQSSVVANSSVLKVSRGTSVVLLIVYILYLLFQLKSHAYMYESTPQEIIDEESHPGVLAEMMDSSSSSDASSTSDSSSTDSDHSGSVAATTKRVRRMFKPKKRRKSSASNTSNFTGDKSILSSPSTQERQEYIASPALSRRESTLAAAVPGPDGADADNEDNGVSRRYDWATQRNVSHDGSKSPEPKKRHKKHFKKKDKKRHHRHEGKDDDEKIAVAETEKPVAQVEEPSKVEFSDDVQIVPASETVSQFPRSPFNMRSQIRPAMTKMLSNNVFTQPAPVTKPSSNVLPPSHPAVHRSQSAGNLRRTNSLPDRLNRQSTPSTSGGAHRTDPLPPYQHQRYPVRKVASGLAMVPGEAPEEEGEEQMSRTSATVLLLCSTALVAVCAEFLVDAIPAMIGDGSTVSEAFIGLIILPIVGNAAEHVTAVTVATKNKMDLAIGVAVGSSIQIALFVTPVVVLLGWILNTNMSLYFNLFETVSLFATVFVVNFLVLDGRSNYLEGTLLIAAYVIIAVVAFFYPSTANQSSVGGGAGD